MVILTCLRQAGVYAYTKILLKLFDFYTSENTNVYAYTKKYYYSFLIFILLKLTVLP
jgi:hypothetical protein